MRFNDRPTGLMGRGFLLIKPKCRLALSPRSTRGEDSTCDSVTSLVDRRTLTRL